jgi:tetratricopeptide (TPR) repeat protein
MRNLIPDFIHRQMLQGARSGTLRAATLFVDISGFTPLTETLMQYGRGGAEMLGETLEAIFVPLVREVHDRGGLIPLFAGDAFTAIFPHDEAEPGESVPGSLADPALAASLNAVQTAISIQNRFAPEGPGRVSTTPYGDFAIRVKVGLSYGIVRWGIPGDSGRHSYYFRGPGVDGCARAEQQAAQGQIVVDETLLPRIREYVVTEPIVGTAFHQVTACTLDLPAAGASLPIFSREDLSPFVASAVLDLGVKAEFREVCPLFVSFEEPEDEATLHNFVAAAMTLADGFGGTFSQVEFGDKGGILVLWFGAPVAYENNAERAAEFLLAFRQQGWPLRWRAGLSSGIAWAGFRGGFEFCEYGLVGDVVNLAARLAMGADWGEIWAGPDVRASLKGTYRFGGRGTVHLKGKRGETSVFALQGKRERAGVGFGSGQLVGRVAELAELAGCIQPIFEGRFAGLVYVHGEAGIGKSRLVHELRQQAEEKGARWFLCPADPILRQSLNPFKRALHHYFNQSRLLAMEQNRARLDAVLDGLVAGLEGLAAAGAAGAQGVAAELRRTRSFLAALVDLRWDGSLFEQLDPKLRFDNMLAAFKTLTLAEAARQPVVIQLEDLHWLDADSAELIRLLTRNVESYPLAVICTSRYRDDGSRVVLEVDPSVPQNALELGALRPEGIRSLAAQILEGDIATKLAAFLGDKTGGNPFFVEQLVLHLREQDMVTREASGLWTVSTDRVLEVPATISAVLIARLDRLVAQVREVVQTAAVLGREFEVEVLSRMLRDDAQVVEWVQGAEEKWIWTALSKVRYLFRHALLRDAAYDMQLRARLRRLHALAGEAIEQLYERDLAPHYADLAYHFGRAGEAHQEWRYARLAGEHAASQFANDEARRHFGRALELTAEEDLPVRYDLTLAREKVCDLQGDREAQASDLAALATLAEGLDDDRRRAEVALGRADYGESIGDYALSMEAAQEAIRLAEATGDVATEAMGYRQWGRAHWRQGDFGQARPHLQAALKRARQAGLVAVEAETLHDLGLAAHHQGAEADAVAHLERALQLFTELNDPRGQGRARNSLGLALRTQGHYDRAQAYQEQSLLTFRQIGDRRGEAMVLNNLGIVSRLRGDKGQARAFYEQALETQREIGDRWNAGSTLNNIGNVLRDSGDYAAAEAVHAEALRVHQEIGNRHGEDIALENLGNDILHQGDYARARTFFERSLAICREVGDPKGEIFAYCYLGTVARSLGDYDAARRLFDEALAMCHVTNYPRGESFGLVAQSLLLHQAGNQQSARECAQKALQITQKLGYRSGQATALLSLGNAQVGLGLLDEAAKYYQDALAIFTESSERHQAMEPLAGLARVSLEQGDLSRAQVRVEEILNYLQAHTLPGGGEPLRVYLTCYRVLSARHDPRARDVLGRAYALLLEQAGKIENAEERTSFLENVDAHREIVAAYGTDVAPG